MCSNDGTRMTFDLYTVWSNLYPTCCGKNVSWYLQLLFSSGERIVTHGPLVYRVLNFPAASHTLFCVYHTLQQYNI